MIVSHELGAVFVKTRKTAGTSIELLMSTLCGPDDIITPVTAEDELLRREMGGRGPQNHLAPAPFYTLRARQVASVLFKRKSWPTRFYNHLPARNAIRYLSLGEWGAYFTFTVERNPWDRIVSQYYWQAGAEKVVDFSTYLHNAPRHLLTNFDLYSEDGHIIVDRVLRYERLAEELAEVWRILGVTSIAPQDLPNAKSGLRPIHSSPGSLYSAADAELVRRVCCREIEAFGYTFPSG